MVTHPTFIVSFFKINLLIIYKRHQSDTLAGSQHMKTILLNIAFLSFVIWSLFNGLSKSALFNLSFPLGYKPPDEGPREYQTIPLSKIEDFGVHCKSYYSLEVSYFKSAMDKRLLDSLWNIYWVNTLSSSSLLTNAEYTRGTELKHHI